jgi:hypothetical protein
MILRFDKFKIVVITSICIFSYSDINWLTPVRGPAGMGLSDFASVPVAAGSFCSGGSKKVNGLMRDNDGCP